MKRNLLIDEIKGLSILAVIVFHLGFFKYGYLGVDVFLVIAGYLTAKSAEKTIADNSFSPWQFVWRRVQRLLPMVLVVCGVSLMLGFATMLPDDYENLAQGVIASSFFGNNILCRISAGNYWAPRNDYLPLLHFWYLGVLMQLYIAYAVIAGLCSRLKKRAGTVIMIVVGILSLASLAVAVCKVGPQPVRFYYAPWRFYEFGAGVLAYMLGLRIKDGLSLKVSGLAHIGAASLSIYAWHYIILAFYRYCLSSHVELWFMCVYFVLLMVLSECTYKFIERSKAWWITTNRGFFCSVVPMFVVVNVLSAAVYFRAGIVRDIPELDVSSAKVERGLHNAYNDRIKEYRGAGDNWSEGGNIKVLVVGNSFGRDFANVILESPVAGNVDLSYCMQWGDGADDPMEQMAKADVVFLAGIYEEKLPPVLRRFCDGDISAGMGKTYYVGTKYFGESNGAIYSRRFTKQYYDQMIKVPERIWESNGNDKRKFGKWFVDMMDVVDRGNGYVAAFTDDRKMISQDCKHLTRGGAKYYARHLDVKALLDSVAK